MTGEQLRAGRAMLKLEQAELAALANVSAETIKRLERMVGPLSAQTTTVDALQLVLEADGVIFLSAEDELPGVRLRRNPPPNIRQRVKRGS